MINSIAANVSAAFQNAGQKLTQVVENVNSETTADITDSISQANLAVIQAQASAVVFKRAEDAERHLLDVIA